MNKTAFAISTALTTFILIAVAGIVMAVRAAEKPPAAVVTETAPLEEPVTLPEATVDPSQDLLLTFSEREAQYQALISRANARLDELQKQQLQLQAQLSDQQAAGQSAINPDQAATIAAEYLGQSNIYSIELILLSGATTYQVSFSSGDTVYVSMDGQVIGTQGPTSGFILSSVPSSQQPTSGGSSSSSSSYEEDDDDDDDDDDEDDDDDDGY